MAEFHLIERAFRGRASCIHSTTRVQNGDDASVHAVPSGQDLVISTDTSVCAVHWPENMPLAQAAERAVCAALSDLAAMGAESAWAWLNVMGTSMTDVDRMAEGATQALNQWQVELAGGDTVQAPVQAISVTVGGLVPVSLAMCRHAAVMGDDLWLCGHTGYAAFGLQQWQAGERNGVFVRAFTHIKPKLMQGVALREAGVRCCIDVSDGLMQDAAHLADASDVSLHLRLESFPDQQGLIALIGEEAAFDAMLNGGEDYALLFTADAGLRATLEPMAIRIGDCREGAGVHISHHGNQYMAKAAGYEHFA